MERVTCAVYCRLSKEDAPTQEGAGAQESESIHNQKNLLISYALSQNWEITHIYADDDYSGADRDRPQWNAMLSAAQGGEFHIILCKNQSRFTRDMEMVERYLHGLFPLWGIRFVALTDNADTQVKGNKKARQINGLVNEWYLEDLSENIRAVLDQKRRAGKFIGSAPVYGYRKNPDVKGHLLVDDTAAETVREIFSLCLKGVGTGRIADQLNTSGVPSPSRYKGSGTSPWHATTVSRILKNEAYLGTMIQGTKRKASYKSKTLLAVPEEQWIRVPGTHEAIIAQEVFDAVQRRLAGRTRSSGKGDAHVLAGKLRCLDCGGTMIKVSNRYKGTPRHYLQCSAYAACRSHPRCTKHSIRLDRLTDAVEERMRHYAALWYTTKPGNLFHPSQTGAAARVAGIRREVDSHHRQLERLSAALSALYLDKVEGVVSPEQFTALGEEFAVQQHRHRQQLQQKEQQVALLLAEDDPAPSAEARMTELLRLEQVDRLLYDLLIEEVAVGERDTASGTQQIHIRWKL